MTEGAICDVTNMAEIAHDSMMDSDGHPTEQQKRLAFFSVYHLCDMIRDLRRKYYAMMDGADGDEDLVAAASELVLLDKQINDFHLNHAGPGDADEKPQYKAASSRRREVISTLAYSPSTSWNGIKAKAAALRQKPLLEDPDRGPAVAVSLAEDIEALADVIGKAVA